MRIEPALLRALEDTDVDADRVAAVLEEALLSAYLEGEGAAPAARVELDRATGELVVWARTPDPDDPDGPAREVDDTPSDFGRVFATTARDVVLRRLREAGDEATVGQWQARVGEVVTGVVRRRAGVPRHVRTSVSVVLQDRPTEVEGVLPVVEQSPGDTYVHGDRLRCLVVGAASESRGPRITLSRTHPGLLRGLLALESPEVADGTVVVAAVAREAGARSKVAVRATRPGVNPKGACIGPGGSRIRAVSEELRGENVDVVDAHDDPEAMVASALAPARVLRVEVVDAEVRACRVVVPAAQLSLAIGKEGQNARLAARLTGWRLDIRGDDAPDPPPWVRPAGLEAPPVRTPRGGRDDEGRAGSRGLRPPHPGGGGAGAPRRSPGGAGSGAPRAGARGRQRGGRGSGGSPPGRR